MGESESLDYFRGKMDAFKGQFEGHVRDTNDRFVRIEGVMKDGFRQSQLDREAGNTTLGEMISTLSDKVQEQQDTLSRGKGMLGLSGRMIDIIVMLCGGCFGGLVMHFLTR